MRKEIVIIGLIGIISHSTGFAASCTLTTNTLATQQALSTICSAVNASMTGITPSGATAFMCTKCQNGGSIYSSLTQTDSTGCTYQTATCECNCSNCTTSAWTAAGTGYQSRTVGTCDCTSGTATCKNTTEYQCAAGYYGTTTNGTSGCSRCPATMSSTGTSFVYGSSAAGSTDISKCYISTGTYKDTSGTFEITTRCYYSS